MKFLSTRARNELLVLMTKLEKEGPTATCKPGKNFVITTERGFIGEYYELVLTHSFELNILQLLGIVPKENLKYMSYYPALLLEVMLMTELSFAYILLDG